MKLSFYHRLRESSANAAIVLLLAVSLAAAGCGGRSARTRPLTSLSEQDQTMLQQYETIRASLAQDDFRTAKRTAAGIQKAFETATPVGPTPPGLDYLTKIANTNALEAQREAFRSWSNAAIALTKDVEGFYVIHCPLPGCGDWLQRDTKVDNPFMGKVMHNCGEVQK